jgi:hypothetical protein
MKEWSLRVGRKIRLTKVDREAFQRALDIVRAEGAMEAARVDHDIKREGFIGAGHGAAYHCQYKNLQLKPWETPPMWVRDIDEALSAPPGPGRAHRAAELLKRMLACGLSRYEPDPLAALATKENPVPEEEARG